MKALLLAGGSGTRLRPLTYTRPKHLLPIANRAHIEHVLDLLLRHGVKDVVMTTSYLAEAFGETIVEARRRGLRVEVTHEPQPLGTAGALRHAAPALGDEAFLALNADVLTDADLGKLVRFHRQRKAGVTLMLTPVEDPSAFGVVPTDEAGLVGGFIEKPPAAEAPTNMINAGIYVMEPRILERIPRGKEWSAERQLFPELVDAGEMYALHLDGYWMDIGTPGKYLQANMDALGGSFRCDVPLHLTRTGALLGEQVSVGEGAVLSLSSVGPGCRIEDGARVERSVLLPGAVVGERSVVDGSILGEGAMIEPGTRLSGATVADHQKVGGDG